jgi:hypothetical protein
MEVSGMKRLSFKFALSGLSNPLAYPKKFIRHRRVNFSLWEYSGNHVVVEPTLINQKRCAINRSGFIHSRVKRR